MLVNSAALGVEGEDDCEPWTANAQDPEHVRRTPSMCACVCAPVRVWRLEVFISLFPLCILGHGLSLNLELVDCYGGQSASTRGPAVSTSPALDYKCPLPGSGDQT